ncbi:MAG: hypothetical protein KJ593_04970 [Candidatus Omnitrophica bacterium]|nr:hypothetical protein [Candidatus Omnitrophota bacterium]
MFKIIKFILFLILIVAAVWSGLYLYRKYVQENKILKQVIERLQADSRIAEVLVTGVRFNEETSKTSTEIKFLEYGADGKPLKPKYFTFSGNIIQFQSLVIRFDDIHIKKADRLRGISAYLFWKVFMLDGPNTQEYEITKAYQIPDGYKLQDSSGNFESKLWENFWKYALDSGQAKKIGIKNAQIEAPGTMFLPGMLYTIKIEHDGGMRIDSSKISPILRGERIPE